MSDQTTIMIRNVDKQTWLEFRAQATRQGKTAGELINELLAEYLNQSTAAHGRE